MKHKSLCNIGSIWSVEVLYHWVEVSGVLSEIEVFRHRFLKSKILDTVSRNQRLWTQFLEVKAFGRSFLKSNILDTVAWNPNFWTQFLEIKDCEHSFLNAELSDNQIYLTQFLEIKVLDTVSRNQRLWTQFLEGKPFGQFSEIKDFWHSFLKSEILDTVCPQYDR
jgi:hypothetical protein